VRLEIVWELWNGASRTQGSKLFRPTFDLSLLSTCALRRDDSTPAVGSNNKESGALSVFSDGKIAAVPRNECSPECLGEHDVGSALQFTVIVNK